MDEGALRMLVQERIGALGITDAKQVGRLVGDVMKTHKGQVEAGDVKRVAEALLAELLGTGRAGAPALGMLAETLLDAAPQEARPALHWLVAKARERLGEVVEAEEALDRAAEKWGTREALVSPSQDVRWTWAELRDRAEAFAAGLLGEDPV